MILLRNFVNVDKLKLCFINERVYVKVLICYKFKIIFKDVYVGYCFLFSVIKVVLYF